MGLRADYTGFHGRLLRSRDVNGLSLTETSYPPGLKLSRHAHKRAHFCIVLQGAFRDRDERMSRSCASSSIIFRPAGAIHSDHFSDLGGRCFNIEIAAQLLERVRDCSVVPTAPSDLRSEFLSSLSARAYREFRETDNLSGLAIEAVVIEMLVEISRRCVPRTGPVRLQWLERARELIHCRFSQSLSLDEIAAESGVHPSHLAREFHRSYGLTIGDYIRRLRIDFACRQISETEAPISEIAIAAGFYDQCHLTRTFKRFIGMTPGEYRKRIDTR